MNKSQFRITKARLSDEGKQEIIALFREHNIRKINIKEFIRRLDGIIHFATSITCLSNDTPLKKQRDEINSLAKALKNLSWATMTHLRIPYKFWDAKVKNSAKLNSELADLDPHMDLEKARRLLLFRCEHFLAYDRPSQKSRPTDSIRWDMIGELSVLFREYNLERTANDKGLLNRTLQVILQDVGDGTRVNSQRKLIKRVLLLSPRK